MKYYKQLDGLRDVAALMVMLFHFLSDPQNESLVPLQIKKATL